MAGGATSTAGASEIFVYRLPAPRPSTESADPARPPGSPAGLSGERGCAGGLEAEEASRVSLERTEGPADAEWIEPLLRQNAVWFCRLRWMVVAALGAAGLAGFFPSALARLEVAIAPGWPWGAAALLSALNLVFTARTRGADVAGGQASVRWLLWAQIVVDLLVLTAVIHWLGSGLPAVPFMYLFHIILACMVFSPRESLGVAGLAATLFLGCLLLEAAGVLAPRSVLVGAAAVDAAGRPSMAYTVVPMLLTWWVIWYLVSRLANALRTRDRELYIANARLKASIEERSMHMLQTTHQLKAPFAAIHAQTQLLVGNYCGVLPDAARTVAERIAARCLVLARQIQEMLQLANLRSQGQTAPPSKEVSLGAVIEDVLSRIEPAARQRGIRFEKQLEPVVVQTVEDHLTMVVDNLVVNAVNYSFDHGVVGVTCQVLDSGDPVLVVRDHGIGISKEKLPRIFDDYYRTEEAVQHNRSSTGLGLAIVRQVAWEDHLSVTVESAPGWGTRMTVTFPGAPASGPWTPGVRPTGPAGGVIGEPKPGASVAPRSPGQASPTHSEPQPPNPQRTV